MNEKGFGLKDFVILFAVIFISLIVIMSIYRSMFPNENVELETDMTDNNQTETHKDLEDKLEKAAERYQNDNYSGNADDPEVWTLSYSMLKDKKYLEKLIDPNDKNVECSGYVEFTQDKGLVSYKPFLKCGSNYQTDGYEDNENTLD